MQSSVTTGDAAAAAAAAAAPNICLAVRQTDKQASKQASNP